MSLLSNVFLKICNKSVKPVEYSDNYKFILQYRTSDFYILSKSENATCCYNYIPDKVSEKGHLISFYNVFQASSKCFVKISSIGLI